MTDVEEIGFGGGCHWCTEAVFAALRGVARVDQGFIRAEAPDDSWSEAVRLAFGPGDIPLDALIEIHLRTHASTSNHAMRGKYRSAIYTRSARQAEDARAALARLQAGFDAPLVTRVLPISGFRASDQRFHAYYQTRPEAPFCRRYIDPKLRLLREEYARHLREGPFHTGA